MKLEIDEALMRSVISEAILTSMDENKRSMLIRGALEHLLTPTKTGGYGPSISPLQSAFQDAAHIVARQVATEMLTIDETVKEKIRLLLLEAFELVMVKNRQETVKRLADAVTAGMAYREGH